MQCLRPNTLYHNKHCFYVSLIMGTLSILFSTEREVQAATYLAAGPRCCRRP